MEKSWLNVGNIAASDTSPFGNKITLFPCPFLIATRPFFILANAFRNGYVVACCTAHRSATPKNELDGYRIVPCLSKMTQHSSKADWIKFEWRHTYKLLAKEHVRNKYSLLKSSAVLVVILSTAKLLTLSILIQFMHLIFIWWVHFRK